MNSPGANQAILQWARGSGLPHYHPPPTPRNPDCLRVHLGHVTADFGAGKLIRLSFQADGLSLDDAFRELSRLFDLCRRLGAYPAAEDGVGEAERRGLYGNNP